ncbi:MAG: hypothetical protein ABIF10_05235 [Candidatus Woesearchaeota archaeon]
MIPYFAVYLAEEQDIHYRISLARQLKKIGLKSLGAQFLFIDLSEMQSFDVLCERALQFKREFEQIFDDVYYSVHAPFKPYSDASIMSNTMVSSVKLISDNFPVKLQCLNIHLSHPSSADWKVLQIDYRKKLQHVKYVTDVLNHMQAKTIISVENPCGITPEPDHVTYLGNLPGDFEKILGCVRNIGFTLDICHSGLVSAACKSIVDAGSCKEFPGFFDEEISEIRNMADVKDLAFLSVADKLTYIHLSDFKGLKHGVLPGKGDRTKEYIMDVLARILARARPDVGVLVEVEEEDYSKSSNTFEALKMLIEWGL